MPLFEVPEDYFQGGSHLTDNEEPFHLPRKPPLRVIINEIVTAVQTLQTAAPGESVKVNASDVVAALLEDKLIAAAGISLSVVDKGGGDLAIEIGAPGSTTDEKVRVSLADTSTGLLVDKIVDADGNPLAIYGAGGDEKVQLPAAGGTGWIYIEDVQVPGGSESGRVWQDAGNTVLQELTVSDLSIEVHVRSSYPLVRVGAQNATLSRDGSGAFYSGSVALTVAGAGPLEAAVFDGDGNEGATDTVNLIYTAPPVISSVNFQGGYPTGPGGLQTEVAENDNFQIAVAADKDFDRVRVLDFGACKLEEFPVADTSSTVVSATIDDEGVVATLRPARVQVRDAVTGAWSATKDTNELGSSDGTHLVNCNNLFPTNSLGAPSYPGAQGALKGSEQATIPITVADYDTLSVTPIGGELTVITGTAPTLTVQRASGNYNVSTANLQSVATRNANGRQVTDTVVVRIAAVAPTISILTPAARLRSGGNDGTSIQNHTITISSDQLLADADMDEDTGGGTFTGSWSGSPPDETWTRVLQVHDNDAKGTYNWQNLSVTNLAGIPQTVISSGGSYVLGGFVQRTITVPAFAASVAFNAEVADFSKVQAGNFSPGGLSVKMPIGTTADTVNGYTVNSVGINPTTLVLLDQSAIAANSLGLYNLQNLEEVV